MRYVSIKHWTVNKAYNKKNKNAKIGATSGQ